MSRLRTWELAALALCASGAVRAVEVDGIVARVGAEAILQSDVQNELSRVNAPVGPSRTEILNEMIDRKLILKAAAESKMTMQEWVVENRVREIVKKAFGGDRNRLIEALGKQRISYPEWYAKTKEDMIISAMRWNVVDKNVTASPTALREEYAKNPGRYTKDHKVSVSVIMLKPDEAFKRDRILADLKVKDFEALGGRKYADINPNELFKPEVVVALEKLSNGELSKWIEIDGWSFLLRKDGETMGEKMSFDEAYDKVEAAVKEAEAKRLYSAWIERLRAETYVKIF